MKKCLLPIIISFIVITCMTFSSCKKTTHFPHPSPGGVRLASYNVVGTSVYLSPVEASYTENDLYSFSYDSLNRLSYIVFSSNNPLRGNEDISFAYSNDTIYKTITSVTPSQLIEKDTFITNPAGQITLAITPNYITSFQYYENLLTIVITTDKATLTAVTNTYTSQVQNFLENTSTAGTTFNQNFSYYKDYTNTIGDYLQIQSFTMYGTNIYQYKNLVNTITGTGGNTTVKYSMDAYSNITSTSVSTVDSHGNDTSDVYTFQYENY